ncbi:hypothetical protein [Streptomyces sp. NPDC001070]
MPTADADHLIPRTATAGVGGRAVGQFSKVSRVTGGSAAISLLVQVPMPADAPGV